MAVNVILGASWREGLRNGVSAQAEGLIRAEVNRSHGSELLHDASGRFTENRGEVVSRDDGQRLYLQGGDGRSEVGHRAQGA